MLAKRPPPQGGQDNYVTPKCIPVVLHQNIGVFGTGAAINRLPFQLSNADGIVEDWSKLYLKEILMRLPSVAAPNQLIPRIGVYYLNLDANGVDIAQTVQYRSTAAVQGTAIGFPIIAKVYNDDQDTLVNFRQPRLHCKWENCGVCLQDGYGARANRRLPNQLFLTIRDEAGNNIVADQIVIIFNVEVGHDTTGLIYSRDLSTARQQTLQSGI